MEFVGNEFASQHPAGRTVWGLQAGAYLPLASLIRREDDGGRGGYGANSYADFGAGAELGLGRKPP